MVKAVKPKKRKPWLYPIKAKWDKSEFDSSWTAENVKVKRNEKTVIQKNELKRNGNHIQSG